MQRREFALIFLPTILSACARKNIYSPKFFPAGAVSYKNFYDNCIACSLCVNVCPTGVLRLDKSGIAVPPVMNLNLAECKPDCIACTLVCPTTSIEPITAEKKLSIKIANLKYNSDNCILASTSGRCKVCNSKCPTDAITFKDNDTPPEVDLKKCNGCGVCKKVCPAENSPFTFFE